MTCFSLTVLFFEKKSRQKKLQLSGTIYRFFRLPCVKGAVGASRLRDCFLQPSNRCAVSEPVSATPASVLRTLANPFHHFVVPLPLHMGGEFRTRLGDACKCASHTRKSLSHKRGLIKINRGSAAPLLFDFLSYPFSPRSGLFRGENA